MLTVHENNEAYRQLLRTSKFKRSQVARELGVAHSTVMRWERGEIVPEYSKLKLLSELSGVPLTIGGTRELPGRMRDGEASVSTLTNDALRALRKLPVEKQRELLVLIRQMIQAASPPVHYGQTGQTPLTDPSGYGNESASPATTDDDDPVAIARAAQESVRRRKAARGAGGSAS